MENEPTHSDWLGPMAVMAFLSLGPYWSWLARLPIPLVSSERVPSRFLLLPALLLMLIAVIRMNDWLRHRAPRTALGYVLLIIGLAELTRGLLGHSIAWQMAHYPDNLKGILFQPRAAAAGIVARADPAYVASIFVGLAITAATAAAWGWWCWHRPGEPEAEPELKVEVEA